MRDILSNLNREAGTKGSMVITPDGIMVAAALGEGFEEDSMAAFAASMLLSFKRGAAALGARTPLKSCSLSASSGKVSFYDMEKSFLVLVTDPGTSLDASSGPVRDAMQKIMNRRIA